jgi:hypothetical protein
MSDWVPGPDTKYLISVFAKTVQPVNPDQLEYDGYTLTEGQSVLAVDEASHSGTEIYCVKDGRLEIDVSWNLIGKQFPTVNVTVIRDAEVASRWDVLMSDGVSTGIRPDFTVDVSKILRELDELDKMLTPRVLAGLSDDPSSENYAYCKGVWDEHEALAAALRQQLEDAEATAAAAREAWEDSQG